MASQLSDPRDLSIKRYQEKVFSMGKQIAAMSARVQKAERAMRDMEANNRALKSRIAELESLAAE